jgi:hypothetical protein
MSIASMMCPSCSTTDAVRAAVFGDEFAATLIIVMLPLLAIAALAGYVHGTLRSPEGP